MAETATADPAITGERTRGLAAELGLGVGSGVAAGVVGTLVSWVPAWILLAAGHDYASIGSSVSRVLVAAAFIIAGVALASYDLVTLTVGAGAIVGAAVGALFGPGSVEGLVGFLGAFGPGVLAGALAGGGGALLGLTQVPPLARREFNAYFYSPIAYVVGTVFLFFFGLFMFFSLLNPAGAEATLSGAIWGASSFLLPIMAPVWTMRLFAEEKRSGTIEVLMTAPVRDWEVVVAKFSAALAAFAVTLVPTLVHVLALYLVSERGPATAPLVGGYTGLVLTAALFIALGLFASSLARDQIVAAVLGFGLCIGVFLLGMLRQLADGLNWFPENDAAREMLAAISYNQHITRLMNGAVDSRSVMYFVSLTAFVLFLTVRAVEARKWR